MAFGELIPQLVALELELRGRFTADCSMFRSCGVPKLSAEAVESRLPSGFRNISMFYSRHIFRIFRTLVPKNHTRCGFFTQPAPEGPSFESKRLRIRLHRLGVFWYALNPQKVHVLTILRTKQLFIARFGELMLGNLLEETLYRRRITLAPNVRTPRPAGKPSSP